MSEEHAFEVTQADIDAGAPNDRHRCPVACALSRAGFDYVDVDDEWIRLRWDTGRGVNGPDLCPLVKVEAPLEVSEFVERFDADEDNLFADDPKPFTFRLALPPDAPEPPSQKT